jgi:hypothetical protein
VTFVTFTRNPGVCQTRESMSFDKLRAWWAHRQGLDGTLAGRSAAEILAHAGWARSVGGASPYLTLFARGGIPREAADRSVAALEIHELPAARGCAYVLPAADFALGLLVGRAFSGAEMKVAAKLGVTEQEVDKLSDAVRKALAAGPADPDQIKAAVGSAARSLGPEGTKKGVSNTLPLALGRLQVAGDIRRVPSNGRLDQQRYRYALWEPNPFASLRMSEDEAATELARRYFRWIGPATLAEFQWFSGLGVKAAKNAVAPLGLAPFTGDTERLMFNDDLEAYRAFRVPKKADYRLVAGLDSLFLLRRGLALLTDPRDTAREVQGEKGVRPMSGLADLPSHAIVDRGRIAGLWEFDPDTATVAWNAFVPADKELEQAVARTAAFVRDQLGDARAFSLDSPKSRQPRIDALRAAGNQAALTAP